jgi:cytidyltransferase-like protein
MERGLGKFKDIIFDSANASKIRDLVGNKHIVFCTGCFDILHSGHSIFFEQCRLQGDVVVVGVGRDSTIKALKGNGKPINPEMNRAYSVAAQKDVDYVVLDDLEIGPGKIDFNEAIRNLKPDIFVLNDDDSGIEEKRQLCEELGIEFVLVSREVPDNLVATSTTEITKKIKNGKQNGN